MLGLSNSICHSGDFVIAGFAIAGVIVADVVCDNEVHYSGVPLYYTTCTWYPSYQ